MPGISISHVNQVEAVGHGYNHYRKGFLCFVHVYYYGSLSLRSHWLAAAAVSIGVLICPLAVCWSLSYPGTVAAECGVLLGWAADTLHLPPRAVGVHFKNLTECGLLMSAADIFAAITDKVLRIPYMILYVDVRHGR